MNTVVQLSVYLSSQCRCSCHIEIRVNIFLVSTRRVFCSAEMNYVIIYEVCDACPVDGSFPFRTHFFPQRQPGKEF